MELRVREPNVGYIDSSLWVPKSAVNCEGTKRALTFQIFEQRKVLLLTLYKETAHHLVVPREFWNPKDFNFPVVDLRPTHYTHIDFKSRILLDHREENGVLVPTGKSVQTEAMAALLQSRGGILQLSCGAGKTVVTLDFIARRRVPTLIVLDTTQLMKQWTEEIAACLEVPGGVGRIQAETFDWRKGIVLATYHTLSARAPFLSEAVRRWFGNIIWDECFAGGTRVDGKPIEKIRVGDMVRSFDHDRDLVIQRKVVHCFASKPSALVRLKLRDGRVFVVTPGHPFYTARGYVPAACLQTHDAVAKLKHHETAHDMQPVLAGVSIREEVAERPDQEGAARVLFSGTRVLSEIRGFFQDNGRDQSEVRIRKNDPEQPDAVRSSAPESLTDSAQNEAQARRTGRQRTTSECAATTATRSSGMGVGVRGANGIRRESPRIIDALQAGSGATRAEADCGDRWKVSLLPEEERARREEGGLLAFVGVDSVEVLERGSDGTYGGLCPDGYVYNLEVDGNNNYFVDDVLVHNCHHVSAPKFSKSADIFYGMRLGLDATPERDDGMHVVHNFHLGPIIYKNLTQDLKPKIYFVWTKMGIDKNNPTVMSKVNDCNGEMHIGRVAAYLGSWRPRVEFVVNQVKQAVDAGRKVIVLSKSVDSLLNMLAVWNDPTQPLVTDLPFPTETDVGESVPPKELTDRDINRLRKTIGRSAAALSAMPARQPERAALVSTMQSAQLTLQQHDVYKKCESLWNKKRDQYLKQLLAQPSTGGLMIYKVNADLRTRMLREKQVTFAIAKYGREGLDERRLDTIIVNEPLSSRNSLQQLIGRVLRKKEGKKEPVAVFLEDDIGPFIGMCRKLRRHLSEWPHGEGGPFVYENVGHITTKRTTQVWTSTNTLT